MRPQESRFFELLGIGMFSIDDEGRIWRHKRFYRGKQGGLNLVDINPPTRAEHETAHGYLAVLVKHNGRLCVKAMAHRLVWTYFMSDLPETLEINHKNGIKYDNCLTNLETVTRSENMKHAYRNGWLKIGGGENHPSAKLNWDAVNKIRANFSGQGRQLTELAKEYGVYPSTIDKIVKRKTWKSG